MLQLSFCILFFMAYVRLFPLTFLFPTVARINLLWASCFFSRGSEEKLLLSVEKEWKETRPVIISDMPAYRKWKECYEPLHMKCLSLSNTHKVSCLTYWLLLFDTLSEEPGDSRFTRSALSCNNSLAECNCLRAVFFNVISAVTALWWGKGWSPPPNFAILYYTHLFPASTGFSSAFLPLLISLSCPVRLCLPLMLAMLLYFFHLLPVQCPAHEVRFDSTGVILSPGYPENYPNLQMCSWLINVEKGYNITLHFELFQTEKEFDILEIFDGGYCQNLTFF